MAGGSPAWGPSSPSGTVRVVGTANRPGGDPRETLSFLRHGTMVREGCPTCRAKRTVPLLPPVLPSPANLAGFAPKCGFLGGFEPPLNLLHDSFPPVLELCSQEGELGCHGVASCNRRPPQTCAPWVPPWKVGIHRHVIIQYAWQSAGGRLPHHHSCQGLLLPGSAIRPDRSKEHISGRGSQVIYRESSLIRPVSNQDRDRTFRYASQSGLFCVRTLDEETPMAISDPHYRTLTIGNFRLGQRGDNHGCWLFTTSSWRQLVAVRDTTGTDRAIGPARGSAIGAEPKYAQNMHVIPSNFN